jgi:chromosome segregation ATPase
MEPADVTIQILQKIHDAIGGLRGDVNALRVEHGERLAAIDAHLAEHSERLERLERYTVATNETLGVVVERLSFFERAATVATEGRARLEDRVDRLESRVDAVEKRDPG